MADKGIEKREATPNLSTTSKFARTTDVLARVDMSPTHNPTQYRFGCGLIWQGWQGWTASALARNLVFACEFRRFHPINSCQESLAMFTVPA